MNGLHQETLTYHSRVDALGPLKADVVFRADGTPKPLVAVLHGFHCTRGHVAPDCADLAALGLCCVAPDMRGHADSAGAHDCGGLQIADLVDALATAAAAFPGEVDRRRLGAVGYSGGGGNVLSLLTKFPELLAAGAAFFGVSDYAAWYRSRGRDDCNRTMDRALGGSPDQVPARYAARASVPGVTNAPAGCRLHLFWDQEETACPPFLNHLVIEAAARAGRPLVLPHESRTTDAVRWLHGYRSGLPQLKAADALFAPDFLARQPPAELPPSGELVVAGYVVTRRFALWLGDGTAGQARVRYRWRAGQVATEIVAAEPDTPALRVQTGPTLLEWCTEA